MGFLDTLKRTLGFGPDDDDDVEVEGIDATVTPLRQRTLRLTEGEASPDESGRAGSGTVSGSGDNVSTAVAAEETGAVSRGAQPLPDMPEASAIFEKVVEIFNGALPAFLQESVDPRKERQALFEALDGSMKDYFNRLEKDVEKRLQGRFEQDRLRLQEEIDSLRQKSRKEEEDSSNARNLQLSAERQKRALSERVHDLEKQIAAIEAENEQYILENKSMANKLRMASLTDGDGGNSAGEAMMEQIAQERSRLDADRSAFEAGKKAFEAEKAEFAAAQDTRQADNGKIEELEKEVVALRESLEVARTKDELNMAMVNDLNSRAAEARSAAQEKENESAEARRKLDEVNMQLAVVNEKLVKAQEDLKVVREVQAQVTRLEETQRLTEATLRRQKDELLEKDELLRLKDADLIGKNTSMRLKDEAIRRLEEQTDSLRRSVENLQYEKTQTESALRSEIERLKSIKGIATAPETAVVADKPVTDIPVSAPATDDTLPDLTLDLPELTVVPAAGATVPKPRRGRPPKVKAPADDVPPAEMPSAEGPASRKRKPVPDKIVAEDSGRDSRQDDGGDFDLLDMTDWLIATPEPAPKPKRQRKQPRQEPADDNFGYKEPLRQEPPDNPAQMLLW